MLSAIVLAVALVGQAEKPAVDELKPQVNKLLRELNAAELSKREAAEEQLAKLGPAILELLPADSDKLEAEPRQRLARIRQQLQQTQSEANAEATTVTLDGDALSLTKVLAAIEKQTGNKITDIRDRFSQPITDPPLKVHFSKTPFWKAMDDVLDQAGLTVYSYSGEAGLALVTRPVGQASRGTHVSYSGPFRVEVTQLSAERDLRNPRQNSLKIHVETSWEPRLSPITLRQSLSAIKCLDADGKALATGEADDQAELEGAVQAGATAVELDVPLPLPDRSVKQIASFQGQMRAMLPGKLETFEFVNLDVRGAKKIDQRKAGATVGIDEVVKNGEVWEVRMHVRFDHASGALESHRGWIFGNAAYLVGADGKPIANAGLETTHQSEDEVGVTYLFELKNGLKGLKFVYKTPGSIVNTPIEYEIKELALP